jgi:hypothetical protein
MRFSTFSALLALPVLAGCPRSPSTEPSAPDRISEKNAAHVTLRRDTRKCASPRCGGYFIKEVNRTHDELYVSALDFSEAKLEDPGAEAELLVLRGRLGPEEKEFKTRTLIVFEAHRGLLGRAPAAGDTFFGVAARQPQITCVTAPCNNFVATRLNHAEAPVEFTRAAMDGVDAACFADRITQIGMLAAGRIIDGEKMPGGAERVLAASQAYVRLPEPEGVCALEMKITRCMTVRCSAGFHCVEEGPQACVPDDPQQQQQQ